MDFGILIGYMIDIWKQVDGQVLDGDYVDYDLLFWDKFCLVVIELIIYGDYEVDFFVSFKFNC